MPPLRTASVPVQPSPGAKECMSCSALRCRAVLLLLRAAVCPGRHQRRHPGLSAGPVMDRGVRTQGWSDMTAPTRRHTAGVAGRPARRVDGPPASPRRCLVARPADAIELDTVRVARGRKTDPRGPPAAAPRDANSEMTHRGSSGGAARRRSSSNSTAPLRTITPVVGVISDCQVWRWPPAPPNLTDSDPGGHRTTADVSSDGAGTESSL